MVCIDLDESCQVGTHNMPPNSLVLVFACTLDSVLNTYFDPRDVDEGEKEEK